MREFWLDKNDGDVDSTLPTALKTYTELPVDLDLSSKSRRKIRGPNDSFKAKLKHHTNTNKNIITHIVTHKNAIDKSKVDKISNSNHSSSVNSKLTDTMSASRLMASAKITDNNVKDNKNNAIDKSKVDKISNSNHSSSVNSKLTDTMSASRLMASAKIDGLHRIGYSLLNFIISRNIFCFAVFDGFDFFLAHEIYGFDVLGVFYDFVICGSRHLWRSKL